MAEPVTSKSTDSVFEKGREQMRKLDNVLPDPHTEGDITRQVETQTSRIPSIAFLTLAVGSMAASAGFEFFGDRRSMMARRPNIGTFIGLWAPTFLLLGIYNKLVKLEGSERSDPSIGLGSRYSSSSNLSSGLSSY